MASTLEGNVNTYLRERLKLGDSYTTLGAYLKTHQMKSGDYPDEYTRVLCIAKTEIEAMHAREKERKSKREREIEEREKARQREMEAREKAREKELEAREQERERERWKQERRRSKTREKGWRLFNVGTANSLDVPVLKTFQSLASLRKWNL
ncbi:hypothetical protein Taro_050066 [Colocasia esculenta]|uniref:Uncharacterized protein n=1 Tax=Colocasia esculenta TaxID=4460 RepID=A0A843XCW8_COLES|nr:hypothetical protein [Colocasia esculenta]